MSKDNFEKIGITKSFLANALGKELEILNYRIGKGSKPGDNFMSVIYSAEVSCRDTKSGDPVTRHLLLKCYPVNATRQEFTNKSNMFFKELEIYRLWIPELTRFQTEVIGLQEPLKLPYASFVFGKCIDFASVGRDQFKGKTLSPLDNFIIMEDLRKTGGFRMTKRRETLDINHTRLVIKELAKTHALSWAYRFHVDREIVKRFPCLISSQTLDDKPLWMTLFNSNIPQAVNALDGALGSGNVLSEALGRFHGLVDSILDVVFKVKDDSLLTSLLRVPDHSVGKSSLEPEAWTVISHGDCWSNNLLFRYDQTNKIPVEAVLVDLQTVCENCVTKDLVHFIYTSTDAPFRKNHIDELLQLYFDSFDGVCQSLKSESLPGFTVHALKHRFHRAKLLGLLTALVILPIAVKDDEEAEAKNMEGMTDAKDLGEMFSDVCKNSGVNPLFNERLIGLVQELVDEGVI